MSARKRVIAIAVLAVIIGLVLLGWSRQAQQGHDDVLVLYGNVDIREIDLAFNGSERIATLTAREGDRVQAGQVLGALHDERLQAAAEQARARVAAQEHLLSRFEAGARDEDIRKARADAEAAQAQLDNARHRLRRVRELTADGLASAEQLDDAQAAEHVAAAQSRAAQAGLELMLSGARDEDIAQAYATLQALQAGLRLAETNLRDAQLLAPTTGVIRNRILEPGDMASAQRPAYTLALLDPVWIRAYVDEPDLGRLHEGQAAEVRTDSFPAKVYTGQVGYISPTAEFTPKSVQTEELRSDLVYQVRVFVDNPQNELRLGMPATVTLINTDD